MGLLHRLEDPGALRVYVASPLGFTEPTRVYYESVLLPALRTAGFSPLDPWDNDNPAIAGCMAAVEHASPERRIESLRDLNNAIGARNVELLDQAHMILAILDGTDVDSGTAAEVGYAAARRTPIVGLRTDVRQTGENDGCAVNLQVEHFIVATGGAITVSLEEAMKLLNVVSVGIATRQASPA
jgi:nucleoside 2-deoxyribosyltransferase